jgi:hypothetical protein
MVALRAELTGDPGAARPRRGLAGRQHPSSGDVRFPWRSGASGRLNPSVSDIVSMIIDGAA